MTKKKVLVLGASLYQLDTIIKAKNLGYEVITTDNVPENPGHKFADKSYNISTTQIQEVLDIACNEKINGVIAACTDVALPAASYISRELGLAGPPLEAVEIVTSKLAFRIFLKKNGFLTPDFFVIESKDDFKGLLKGDKWVIKPDKSSGSKGVYVISDEIELEAKINDSFKFSLSDKCVLERFIDGFQGTCEGILKNGEIVMSLFTDRLTAPLPYTATWGHYVPTKLSKSQQDAVISRLNKIWHHLKVFNGPFDSDFVIENEEIYIIELAPRMGGNSLTKLLKNSIDFDIIEYSLRYVCGEEIKLNYNNRIKPVAVVLLGVLNEGKLNFRIEELNLLKKEDWVLSLSVDYPIGSHIKPFINGRNRIGETVIVGTSRQDIQSKANELLDRLQIEAV
jgi:biotin carboxylase